MTSKKLAHILVLTLLFCAIFIPRQAHASTYIYSSKFGSSGTGNGQFNLSYGIALDSSGNIYVTDQQNNRVQIFNSSGVYQSQFGSFGTGNGQFTAPSGIALDSSGNMYVTDTNNNRVQIFNSSGVYQSQFGGSGTGNGQFNTADDVALDSSGNIYVTDTGNNRVQIFNSSGVYQSQFGSFGTGDGQFKTPTGITVSSSGNIYVADSVNRRIQVFNSSGVFQFKFGSSGSGNGQFNFPKKVALDSSGNIYVADYTNRRVQIFNSSGIFQAKFGSSGTGDGQFDGPSRLVLDSSGNIYVSDSPNHRVQKFIPVDPATLATSPVSAITYTTATLNGSINSTGGVDATEHGFAYGTSSDLSIVIATTTLGSQSGTGSFTSDISSLTQGTTYYVRAYATNSAGTGYGTIESFTTTPYTSAAVTTTVASSVLSDGATLNGSIGNTGGVDATEHGFEYGTSPDLSTVINTSSLGPFSGTGAFSENITGLVSGNTYYFRAYATNSVGTTRGTILSFRTDVKGSSGSVSPQFLTQILANHAESNLSKGSATSTPSSIPGCPTNFICLPNPPKTNVGRTFVPYLSIGSRGNDVTKLQHLLVSMGFLEVTPTGYFGTLTEQALRAYQTSKHISPVGFVGPQTMAALNADYGNSAKSAPPAPKTTSYSSKFTRDLTIGSVGEDVRYLQEYLNSVGFFVASSGNGSSGFETKVFGPRTRDALAEFQRAHDISPANGYFGPITRGYITHL